jgi:outer membrane receptor protein involved in Fe transport
MADVPQAVASVGGTLSHEGYRLDVQARYVGNQHILNETTGVPDPLKIPSYFLVDLAAEKTFALKQTSFWAKSLKVSIRVDNLFNKYYYNEAYTEANEPYVGSTEFAAPGAPRSVIGRLEVDF